MGGFELTEFHSCFRGGTEPRRLGELVELKSMAIDGCRCNRRADFERKAEEYRCTEVAYTCCSSGLQGIVVKRSV